MDERPVETPPKKVVDIAKARNRGETAMATVEPSVDRPPPPIPRAQLYLGVTRAINRDSASLLPAFPRRFHVVELAPGVRSIVEELEDGVVRHVDPEAVTNCIVGYTARDLAGRPGFQFDVRAARAAMEYWRAVSHPIPEPKAVAWRDDLGTPEAPVRTFSRLPWTYTPDVDEKDMPHFAELLSRVSNAAALVEWIGSLFDPKADRQQYVWIYGEGQNGKGALVRFLAKVLGHAFRAKQPPHPNDKHWTAGLIGARLVVFPDCNAFTFPATGLFKSLTGGDQVDIDPKYERPYSAELAAKFLFLSNGRPEIPSDKASLRRAIYCEAGPIKGEADPTYEAKLWAEGGAFLSRCIANYCTQYPQGGPIRVDSRELEEWVAVVEEDFEALVSSNIELGPEHVCLQSQWAGFCRTYLKDPRVKRAFCAYLERKHGVRFDKGNRRSVRTSLGVAKAYGGFRLRTPAEQGPHEVDETW